MTDGHCWGLFKIVHSLLGGNHIIHSFIHSFMPFNKQTASRLCTEAVRPWGPKDDSLSGTWVWCSTLYMNRDGHRAHCHHTGWLRHST